VFFVVGGGNEGVLLPKNAINNLLFPFRGLKKPFY
jgi:hypothetical protein